MARPEGFEPPTTWFVELQPNLSYLLFLLLVLDFYCPILSAYMPFNALNYSYMTPVYWTISRQFFPCRLLPGYEGLAGLYVIENIYRQQAMVDLV